MRSTTALSFHILSAKEMIKSGYGQALARTGQLALRGMQSLRPAVKAIPSIGKIPPTVPKVINKLGGPATAIAAGGLGAGSVGALNSGSDQSMGPAFNGGIGKPPAAAIPGISPKADYGGGVGEPAQPGRIQLNPNTGPVQGWNTQGITPQTANPAWNQTTRGLTTPEPARPPSNTYGLSNVPALDNLQGAHLPGNMGDAVVPESAPQAPPPMQGPVDERSLQGLDDSTNPENLATSQQMQKPESAIAAPAPLNSDSYLPPAPPAQMSMASERPESAIAAPAPLNSDSYLPPAPPAQMSMASERPVQSAPGLTFATPPPMDISAPEPTRAVPPSIPQATVQARPQQPSAQAMRDFQVATKSRFNPNSKGDVASMQQMMAAQAARGGARSSRLDSQNTMSPSQYAASQRRAPMGGVKRAGVGDALFKAMGESMPSVTKGLAGHLSYALPGATTAALTAYPLLGALGGAVLPSGQGAGQGALRGLNTGLNATGGGILGMMGGHGLAALAGGDLKAKFLARLLGGATGAASGAIHGYNNMPKPKATPASNMMFNHPPKSAKVLNAYLGQ